MLSYKQMAKVYLPIVEIAPFTTTYRVLPRASFRWNGGKGEGGLRKWNGFSESLDQMGQFKFSIKLTI